MIIIKAIVFVAPEDKLGKQDEILHNPILRRPENCKSMCSVSNLGLNCWGPSKMIIVSLESTDEWKRQAPSGLPLVVQWLRFWAIQGIWGSILGQGTRPHRLQLRDTASCNWDPVQLNKSIFKRHHQDRLSRGEAVTRVPSLCKFKNACLVESLATSTCPQPPPLQDISHCSPDRNSGLKQRVIPHAGADRRGCNTEICGGPTWHCALGCLGVGEAHAPAMCPAWLYNFSFCFNIAPSWGLSLSTLSDVYPVYLHALFPQNT